MRQKTKSRVGKVVAQKQGLADVAEAETSDLQKKIKTFELRLSMEELVHLRDIMSVLLPPDGSTTLSQSLAQAEKRVMVESKLWDKIVILCKHVDVPMGDDAPDYVIGMAGPPSLRVYQLHMHDDANAEGEHE